MQASADPGKKFGRVAEARAYPQLDGVHEIEVTADVYWTTP